MWGFGIVYGPCIPLELLQQSQGKDMSLGTEIKTEVQKFEGWIKTLELKFFKGKLHQKVVSPHPADAPDHAWVPIASHDVEAPAAGEPIAVAPPPAETGSGAATGPQQQAAAATAAQSGA
jgi:hypothetical protein